MNLHSDHKAQYEQLGCQSIADYARYLIKCNLNDRAAFVMKNNIDYSSVNANGHQTHHFIDGSEL